MVRESEEGREHDLFSREGQPFGKEKTMRHKMRGVYIVYNVTTI